MLKSSILFSGALAVFRGLQLAEAPQNFAGGHVKDLEIILTDLEMGQKGNERIVILDSESVPVEGVAAVIERMVLEYGDEGVPEESIIRVVYRSVHFEADLVRLGIDSVPTDSGFSENLVNHLSVQLRTEEALKNLRKAMDMGSTSRAPMSFRTTSAPWTVTPIQTPPRWLADTGAGPPRRYLQGRPATIYEPTRVQIEMSLYDNEEDIRKANKTPSAHPEDIFVMHPTRNARVSQHPILDKVVFSGQYTGSETEEDLLGSSVDITYGNLKYEGQIVELVISSSLFHEGRPDPAADPRDLVKFLIVRLLSLQDPDNTVTTTEATTATTTDIIFESESENESESAIATTTKRPLTMTTTFMRPTATLFIPETHHKHFVTTNTSYKFPPIFTTTTSTKPTSYNFPPIFAETTSTTTTTTRETTTETPTTRATSTTTRATTTTEVTTSTTTTTEVTTSTTTTIKPTTEATTTTTPTTTTTTSTTTTTTPTTTTPTTTTITTTTITTTTTTTTTPTTTTTTPTTTTTTPTTTTTTPTTTTTTPTTTTTTWVTTTIIIATTTTRATTIFVPPLTSPQVATTSTPAPSIPPSVQGFSNAPVAASFVAEIADGVLESL